jgi:SAM-dependent methyltransferase
MDPEAAAAATAAAGLPGDIKERLKASYDAIAPTYNEWTIPHSKQRMHYLEKALGYLNASVPDKSKDLAFLELGCGCGLPVTEKLLSYASATARVVANDLSEAQIALARENLFGGRAGKDDDGDEVKSRLELIQGDMNTLNFPNGSFDLVVGFYSIIHLPRSEQARLLERIAQWLRPGGYFVANFTEKEAEAMVNEKWLDDDKGWMFWSGWGEEKTLGKIRDAGLEVVVADVVAEVVDASFLWVIAKR